MGRLLVPCGAGAAGLVGVAEALHTALCWGAVCSANADD